VAFFAGTQAVGPGVQSSVDESELVGSFQNNVYKQNALWVDSCSGFLSYLQIIKIDSGNQDVM